MKIVGFKSWFTDMLKPVRIYSPRRDVGDPEGRLHNQHVRRAARGNTGLNQVSILFQTVVTRVQHLDAVDIDHEHRCSEDMPRRCGGELDTSVLDGLMIINHLNLIDAVV